MLLGIFGLSSNWAAAVDYLHLPDCNMCFVSCLHQTIVDRYSAMKLATCRHCCQRDMCSPSPALKKVLPEGNYPSTCHPQSLEIPAGRKPGSKFIIPVKKSFAWLQSVFDFISFNVKAITQLFLSLKLESQTAYIRGVQMLHAHAGEKILVRQHISVANSQTKLNIR